MTRLAHLHGAVNLSQGFPDFAAPRGGEGGRAARGRRPTSTSTRSPGARAACARPSPEVRGASTACPWIPSGSHRHLRLHRGHDRGPRCARPGSRATRWWSSSPSTRTTARTRSCPAPCPRFVNLRPPDWSFDPDELAPRLRRRARGPSSSTRPTTPRARCSPRAELETIAGPVPPPRRAGRHRRDLRAHPLRRRRARAHRHAARHGGAHHHHQRHEQDLRVTGWRVGWAIAPRHADQRHPQGARLPDRGRGGAAAGGGRAWP